MTYLDARTLQLKRDGIQDGRNIQFAAKSNINILLNLHGIELANDGPARTEPRRMELNHALAAAHVSKTGQDAYERWCQQYLRYLSKKQSRSCRHALDDAVGAMLADPANIVANDVYDRILGGLRGTNCLHGGLVQKQSQFTSIPIPFPTHPALTEVAAEMRSTFGVDGDSFVPKDLIDKDELGFKHIKDLVKYLDGDWVEHLTLAAFLANQDKHNICDVGMSLRTKQYKSADRKDPWYDFEFDIAAMQGYQLYAVSCTRTNRSDLCKSKLFEACVRAIQLGGDEAKIGLVCCSDKPGMLQKEATELWRVDEKRIRVFGPQDFPHLSKRFAKWLSA